MDNKQVMGEEALEQLLHKFDGKFDTINLQTIIAFNIELDKRVKEERKKFYIALKKLREELTGKIEEAIRIATTSKELIHFTLWNWDTWRI